VLLDNAATLNTTQREKQSQKLYCWLGLEQTTEAEVGSHN
jgi:hypothetical protein